MLIWRSISKIINIILALIMVVLLVASIGTAITKEPMFLSVIRSNSMYPVFERGDIVMINKVGDQADLKEGDIVVFTTPEGNLSTKGHIIHRIMEGDHTTGFITQGDANSYTDQLGEGSPPIQPEWVTSRALTIGDKPIVIPFVGFVPLLVEDYQTHPLLLPGIAICLALIIGINELYGNKKKRKRKRSFNPIYLYLIGGLTISVMMAGTMIASSQHITMNYGISESSNGALMGSSVGIVQVGETIERELTELNNGGFFPFVATVTSKDKQFDFNVKKTYLRPNESKEVILTLSAETPGQYTSTAHVALFYPFLPVDVVYFLASKSYWLALVILSLLPGLPIMIYPLFDYKIRHQTKKDVRQKIQNVRKAFPI